MALEVAVARGDANLALRLVAPVGWYFYMVGQADLGSVALEDALSCPGPVERELRAIVLAHYGWLSANGPNMAIALDATEEAFALVAGTSDPWTETFVTITRIMSLFFSGRRDQLQELLPIAEEASRRSTDGWSAAIVALVRGVVAQFDGDPERTEQSLWEAVRPLRGGRRRVLAGDRPDRGLRDRRDVRRLRRGARRCSPAGST